MSNLSPVQIGRYAYDAGFRGKALADAIAVALAESGGNPRAVGVNHDRYRSRDRGLWQINSHWHPEVTDAQAFSPASNAAAAFRISHSGTNWSPWSTWHNGSAQAQLGRATFAARQVQQTPSSAPPAAPSVAATPVLNLNPGGSPLGPLDPGGLFAPGAPGGDAGAAIGGAVTAPLAVAQNAVTMATHVGAWVSDSHNWSRVALVVAGSGGVLLGLAMLGKSGAAGSTAASVTSIPGKAAKVAALL